MQAKDLANEILQLTSSLKITGQPDLAQKEVDAYVDLIERREPMVMKLTQLIKEGTGSNENLKQAVDEVLFQIIQLDKEHLRIMEHIKKSITTSLKETRSGQKLNRAYLFPMADMGHGLLDARQ